MGNAIWLFFALPEWYFSTILAPFRTGLLSAIPALGIVCLIFGVVCGTLKRRLDLSAFLVLPVASQALALVAGFMRGSLTHQVSEPILAIFTLLQIAVAGYFIFRLEGART
ncbi:MAG TPA: hypothetical protein VGA65_05090, partial [Hyphomicrobium sp.]